MGREPKDCAYRKPNRHLPPRILEKRFENEKADKTKEYQRGVTARFRRIKDCDIGKADQEHGEKRGPPIAPGADEPSHDNHSDPSDFGQDSVSRPVSVLGKEVNKKTVEVMIVVVMGPGKNAESGVKFADKLYGPDLVHPKIVHGRTRSNKNGGDACDQTDYNIDPLVRRAGRFQSFNETCFEKRSRRGRDNRADLRRSSRIAYSFVRPNSRLRGRSRIFLHIVQFPNRSGLG